ncbi:MAG: hypothetical protein IH898_13170 [Planctomycetes bacterium]|nr:hypothetical protein [Planctomycetota bacterium]
MHGYSCWALFALSLCCCTAAGASAGWAAETSSSTTSSQARNEAVRAIPFQRIAPNYRRRVKQVLNDTSLYRRLPTMTVDCHPPLFTFLAKNPDVLVQIWRQLGISNIDLVRVGNNKFRLTDSVGTVGHLVIVEQNCDDLAQNRLVMYAEGAYEGKPFKRPVRAQCVLLLRSGSVKETNGRHYVAVRLDTFLRIDRASLELFAKAVHPLVGRTTDRNFADTINFIGKMSQAAETRPLTIERLANSLPHISADRKRRLVNITHECADQQAQSSNSTATRLANTAE